MTATQLKVALDAIASELVAIRDTFDRIEMADKARDKANGQTDSLNGDRIVDPAHKLQVKDTGRVKLELKGKNANGEYVIALIHADTVKTVERIGQALTA